MKRSILIIRFGCMLIVSSPLSFSRADDLPLLNLSLRSGKTGISVSWRSSPGAHYELQKSGAIKGEDWRPVGPLRSGKGGETLEVVLPFDSNRQYFRVVQKDIAGFIALSEGQELFGAVSVQVTNVFAADARVQYAALLDIVGSRTNVLGWTSDAAAPEIRFEVDSTRMKSGVDHTLIAMLVDDYGDVETGDGVRVVHTDPVRVRPINPLSLNGFGDTEWMFHLSFSSEFSEGSWRVVLQTSAGSTWRTFSGDIASSLNEGGEILVRDIGRTIDTSYPAWIGDHLKVDVSVTHTDGRMHALSTFSPIRRRAAPSSAVIEEGDMTNWAPGIRFNSEFLFGEISQTMALLADHVDISTGTRTDVPDNWNRAASLGEAEWLNRAVASHAYIYARGRPASIGSITDPFDLASGEGMSVIPTFVFIDGHNAPLAFISRSIGLGTLTIEDVRERGRFPKCGIFFIGRSFPSLSDISDDDALFVREFFRELYTTDPLTGLRTHATYGSAVNTATERNPLADHFRRTLRIVGCADLRVDE